MTLKQIRFVEQYIGNGRAAAAAAGYRGSDAVLSQTAYELLIKPEIQSAISNRRTAEMTRTIADRNARQEFWTDIMHDPLVPMKDRLRASELLGKSEADFRDRLSVESKMTLGQLVEASWRVDDVAKPDETGASINTGSE